MSSEARHQLIRTCAANDANCFAQMQCGFKQRLNDNLGRHINYAYVQPQGPLYLDGSSPRALVSGQE
jgi:hypothetical protein